ncbi:hypothetical protein DPMN_012551 [Dreissena polymorpha]|uniref:Uncharacterized protein n=1 Tax=Dreissena polymorpha TaxID=45954 RepID=A0A9D4N3M5_DREPO|nr:hypothetical protein DPMN_012551 [Dreissena polymorpha]
MSHETLLQQLNIKPKWRSHYIPMAVSSTKIPFSPAPEEQKKNKKDFGDLVHEDGSIHLIPDSDGQCVCGGDWLEETELECTRIISATDMLHAKVYIRNCSSCDRFKDYDGILVSNLTPIELTNRILYRSYLWHTGGKCSNMLTILDLRDTWVCRKLLRKYDSSITGPVYELMCVHILRDVKRVQNEKDQTAQSKHRCKSLLVAIL